MSIKESALTAIQTIADTDFFRAVTSVGASRKVLASDVGKYVLENYESELAGSEQSVTDAIDAVNDDLNEKNADVLDRIKKSLIVDSASGSIASFNDGNDVFPFISCVADITPLQDLHGYDKPWVGGAGKNKLPNTATTKTQNGVTFTVNSDGTVLANGTATSTFLFNLCDFGDLWASGSYVVSGCPSGGGDGNFGLRIYKNVSGSSNTYASDFGSGATFTGTTSLKCAIVIWSGKTLTNALFKPMIRLASVSDATFEPWENICPITGFTGCDVSVSGKNLYGGTYLNYWYLPLPQGTTVRVRSDTTTKIEYCRADKTAIDYWTLQESNGYKKEFTLIEDTTYFRFYHSNSANCQITFANESWDYEPFGQTYPISWQTEAGAVYGGTVDVVSGVLTVTHKLATFDGSESWGTEVTSDGRRNYYLSLSNASKMADRKTGALYDDLISNMLVGTQLAIVGQVYVSSGGYLNCRPGFGTTASDWTTFLSSTNLQVWYPLATPITYQLDPVQVACLLGQNNVWADCGDIEEVKFYADPTIYISNLLGTKEDNFTADSAISEGDVFSIGDNIYKATATIAVGETIAVGTNCVQTSITEQINALYALL